MTNTSSVIPMTPEGCSMRWDSWYSIFLIPSSIPDLIKTYPRRNDVPSESALFPFRRFRMHDASYSSEISDRSERENGAEGEIRTPEDYSSGFRDRRHTGLGYLGLSIPTASRYLGISGDVLRMRRSGPVDIVILMVGDEPSLCRT